MANMVFNYKFFYNTYFRGINFTGYNFLLRILLLNKHTHCYFIYGIEVRLIKK